MKTIRLRLLLGKGELPYWIGKLLLQLDQQEGIALQLRRQDGTVEVQPISALSRLWRKCIPALKPWSPNLGEKQRLMQWEAAAAAETCDIALVLDASQGLFLGNTGAAQQWVVVDRKGQSLCPHFPLLASICTNAGLQLTLQQLKPPENLSRPIRRIHLHATSHYRQALEILPDAVRRLVEQALTDIRLGIARPTTPSDEQSTFIQTNTNLPAHSTASPCWQGMRGFAHAFWRRLQARLLSEYWNIGIIDAPLATLLNDGPHPSVRWLTRSNTSGYWADPFGLPGDTKRLVCEYFDERTGVGHLEVLQIDAKRQVTARCPLPVGGGQHVSFPNVFEYQGRRLGVAEAISSRQCVLHEVDANGNWHALFPLLENVAAADPALVSWEGRLWLAFTDVDLGNLDNLCLYYADCLEGPWHPHANNPVKVDVTSSRMAGGFFIGNGCLYRPAQDCLETYGAAVAVQRIEQLTPEHFEETPVRRIAPDSQGLYQHGLHTLNAWGEQTLIDGKRHGINLIALWRNLRHRLGSYRAKQHNATRQRLLVYVPHLRVGGGEISMLRLAEGLAASGVEVDLVVHSKTTSALKIPPGVSLHSLDCSGTAAAVWRLVRLLKERRPDWILSAFPHTNIAAVTALALSGVGSRCVITEHAPLSRQIVQQGNWRYRILPALVGWAYRRADTVVAVSSGVRDDLQKMLGQNVTLDVINNPVLAGNFEAEMALQPDDPWLADNCCQVILSVCRLSVEKDLPTLIRAFSEVHRKHPGTRLILAGDGPDRPRLEALIREMELTEVVRLPGYTATPLAWMRRAAVFVLASQYEGFGNALVEAMACGTPVVSTDCPVGPREILEGGRFGRLVPVGDVSAMAQAIAGGLAEKTPPPGAQDAALRYTQANACATYLQLFKRLDAGGTRC